MSKTSFVHLKTHSDFSLHDGLMNMGKIASAVKEKGMGSVAVTDHMNLFGAIKNYKKMMDKGVKPIIGADVMIIEEGQAPYYMTLLCQNNKGYNNLTRLISQAYSEGYLGETATLRKEWVIEKSEGIIALSGARKGDVGQSLLKNNKAEAQEKLEEWVKVFGDRYYIELQRTGHPEDEEHVSQAVQLAIDNMVPVVATNNVMFKEQSDFEAHQIRASVAKKVTLEEFKDNYKFEYSRHQFLKSPEEMQELFSDIPTAITNTVGIASRCSIEIELGKADLPIFPTPNGEKEDDFLITDAKIGLTERLSVLYDVNSPEFPKIRKEYDERLQFELEIINSMGFAGYFLIVSDFIKWSKENDVPVGPGRGSGAGSLVAYVLKITDIDPLEYDLLFERFLNPERVSMPDFDIDFCKYGRDRVIKYVSDTYGKDSVSQIITYGTMAARAVVRDVARVLGKPYMVGDRISKLIPNDLGITLTQAMEDEAFKVIYESEPEVRQIIDYSLALEGLTRQVGKHAGGVVISPTVLTDYTPTYNDSDGSGLVSAFDKNDVEEAGLVKFDFLGLKTLTIIDGALKTINKNRHAKGLEPVSIDLNTLDLKDKKTFELFSRAETTAVFQLESKGMKDLIKRLKPETVEDIIALVALYRPGPMDAGMLDMFCDRKNGIAAVEYLHPMLNEVLANTYGVLVYQEQVMQTAQVLAGYSLGQADMLRRAMGKKKPEEMAKQRSGFVEGCEKNGIDATEADEIFSLIEKFAGYGFNKSHSAAYGLIAYQTAWLKAHYPAEFMASVLSQDMDDTDKVVNFINECRSMGLEVLPPDVNSSEEHFTVDAKGRVIYGLTAVKGLGKNEVAKIINERNESGTFSDIFEFQERCRAKKTTLEAGIKSGIFDTMDVGRSTLMETYPKAQDFAKKKRETVVSDDQLSMFSDDDTVHYEVVPEWSEKERLAGERSTLGLYLTGHPVNEYEEELSNVITDKLGNLSEIIVNEEDQMKMISKGRHVKIAGMIMDMRVIKTRRGKMAVITLDDNTRQMEAVLYMDTFNRCQHLLREDEPLIMNALMVYDEKKEAYKLIVRDVETMDMMRESQVSNLLLSIDKKKVTEQDISDIKRLIQYNSRGSCLIEMEFTNEKGNKQRIRLDNSYRTRLNEMIVDDIAKIIGKENIKIEYKSERKKEIASGTAVPTVVVVDENEKKLRQEKRARRFENFLHDATIAMSF